ncbi:MULTISPECIES: DoxX family protein [unclassified Rhizobium]|uniref:DoxX family protein n=1 Tax=unclassified Rhizobium TaxID=2613769 RepID=UPI00104C34DA|nr:MULTISPECIES: DoxX family protein [unclassified Rhizobium]MBB3399223.1 putative oxidoreductase [Rhizobium sp. BK060]MBB4169890.1 putative oxidoreductase [Rhizobium sp. BK538]TCM66695.1 putative oxidoreductase [Rhizobium sp. BK068]
MADGKSSVGTGAIDIALLIGRLLLAWIFLHEGVSLALNFSGAVEMAAQFGLSVPLLVATIALQIGAGLSIAAGLLTRVGATALGLFCVATATLYHTNFSDQNELFHFEKDLAIAGGMFVLAAVGAGSLSIDSWLRGRGL